MDFAFWSSMIQLLVLAEEARAKLPPPTRAAAIMALIGIALLGMLLVVVILLGGHWVRRQGSYRRGRSVPPDRRPLIGESEPGASTSRQPPELLAEDATADSPET